MDPKRHAIPERTDRPGPWDGYLLGPENAIAQAGAMALVRGEPGIAPLVVVGPAGSGKSRLLDGLVADWLHRRPGSAIAHHPAEMFAAACHEAAAVGTPSAWADLRDRFRSLDLFVLDDLHSLSRSPMALDELVPTLDALDEAGAAVSVSARDGPASWRGWPARLVDRLRSGLLVRLDRPSPDTRRRYLLDQARRQGLTLSAEALDALVEAADGYRLIDGWLVRLALAARVHRRPIDRALVDSVLNDPDDPTGPAVTIAAISRAVADHFGVRLRDLRSSSRRAALVEPRHLAIYLCRELTGVSYATLGASFGRRDPKTIRHACLSTSSRLGSDPALSAVAESLRRRWTRP